MPNCAYQFNRVYIGLFLDSIQILLVVVIHCIIIWHKISMSNVVFFLCVCMCVCLFCFVLFCFVLFFFVSDTVIKMNCHSYNSYTQIKTVWWPCYIFTSCLFSGVILAYLKCTRQNYITWIKFCRDCQPSKLLIKGNIARQSKLRT